MLECCASASKLCLSAVLVQMYSITSHNCYRREGKHTPSHAAYVQHMLMRRISIRSRALWYIGECAHLQKLDPLLNTKRRPRNTNGVRPHVETRRDTNPRDASRRADSTFKTLWETPGLLNTELRRRTNGERQRQSEREAKGDPTQ